MASIDSWIEWKKKCALGRCSAEAKRDLLNWSAGFIKHWAECSPEMPLLTKEETWHLIETHVIVPRIVKGDFVSYKEWLFGRPHTHGSELDLIQGGAWALARDAIKKHYAKELSGRRFESVDEEIRGKDGILVKKIDLLPPKFDGNEDVILQDYQQIAAQEASALFDSLNERQHVMLLANYLEFTANDPRLWKAAGCQKQVLYDAQGAIADAIRNLLKRNYPDEGNAELFLLGTLIARELQNLVVEKKKAEKWYHELFSLVVG